MVRFSCFSTNIHYHRSKKEFQQSVESMNKASEYFSKDQGFETPGVLTSIFPLLKESGDNPSITSGEQETSFYARPPISGEMLSDNSPETNVVINKKTGLKKSQSLGFALNREGRHSGSTDSEGERDEDFSCDRFNEINHSGVGKIVACKDPGKNSLNKYDKAQAPESFQGNERQVPSESIFSIADNNQLELDQGDIVDRLDEGYTGELGYHKPDTPLRITKSCSLPKISFSLLPSKEGSPSHGVIIRRCRSSEDLNALIGKNNTNQIVRTDQERENIIFDNREDPSGNAYGDVLCNYAHYEKEWTVSKMNEVEMIKTSEGASSVQNVNELPNKDFKIKRIQEWVDRIDLKETLSDEDICESSYTTDKAKKGSYMLGNASTTKLDSKSTYGMEAAKNYVSSLPASSTSAQLANLGLVVVPFLSTFNSLKTLNLSGNAIVRITSGALPRGLHVLNLAKNNISSIEGLRELTRLRVLDLSYNRILRIGHGLVSCSSLKELYLAGNKISEVEGLHRLLKLNILDLRFNKISTPKCLGQLAANYSSLQAINLEGNPAQRNVGDEHLKKYLQSILPHLVYFNKQTIRASSSKEVADRSGHSAITSHQLDRGMRSEHKLIRSTGKASSSSIHGHKVQAVILPKQSKDRLGRLPPSGTKGSHRHHYLDFGSRLLGLRSDLLVRRSQSEGNLGAL